ERADVYALGAMLYHVLAGVPPYEGRSSTDLLERVQQETPTPLDQRQPSVPRDLLTIVAKAMSRQPAYRYSSASELADDLKRFQTGQLVLARSYSRLALLQRWVNRHRVPVLVSAVATLVLVGAITLNYRHVLRERNVARARGDELTLMQARASL